MWYSGSPRNLRDPAFILAQANEGFQHRRAQIARGRINLPKPVELMVVARPPGDRLSPPAHVLEIVRRMAGYTHQELATAISWDRADLTAWVRKPTTEGPGAARMGDAWKVLRVSPEWASTGEHSMAPSWLIPWIEWDAQARAKGYRDTIDERRSFMQSVDKELHELTSKGYESWCQSLAQVMERFPARPIIDEQEARLLNALRQANAKLYKYRKTHNSPPLTSPLS